MSGDPARALDEVRSLIDRHEFDAALEAVDVTLARLDAEDARTHPIYVRVLFLRAEVLVRSGDAEGTLNALDRLQSVAGPQDGQPAVQLPRAAVQAGITALDERIGLVREASRIQPDLVPLLLARLRLQLGLDAKDAAIPRAVEEITTAAGTEGGERWQVRAAYELARAAVDLHAAGLIAEAQRTIERALRLDVAQESPQLTRDLRYRNCYYLTELDSPHALSTCDDFIRRYQSEQAREVRESVAQVMSYRSLIVRRQNRPGALEEGLDAVDQLIAWLQDGSGRDLQLRLANALNRKVRWSAEAQDLHRAVAASADLRRLLAESASGNKRQVLPLIVDVQAVLGSRWLHSEIAVAEMLAIADAVMDQQEQLSGSEDCGVRARAKWNAAIALETLGRAEEAGAAMLEVFEMGPAALEVLAEFETLIRAPLASAYASLCRAIILADQGQRENALQELKEMLVRFGNETRGDLTHVCELGRELEREMVNDLPQRDRSRW